MNEELNIPKPPPDARSEDDADVPESRCDNYDEYLEETLGYTYRVRDVVALGELESHDRLREAPATALEDRSFDELSDLEKLGFAHGLRRIDDLDGFARVIEALLQSGGDDPGVEYAEIPLLGAVVMQRAGYPQRARSWLDRALEKWPERQKAANLLKGRAILHEEGLEAAIEHYEALADSHPDDPELCFEIAEALAAEEKPKLAARWLERARTTANRVDDRAILVDIEVLERRLSERARS